MSEEPTVSWPLRMPASLADQIKLACKLTDLSQQDVSRLSMRIGLEYLKRCNYDLAKAVIDSADKANNVLQMQHGLNESQQQYGKKKPKQNA